MNTRKTIYDKLFTEKVELAKHEVELVYCRLKSRIKRIITG
jgi:hypothetical protein